ncbi:S41 family peptidase [Sphingobacterium sp. UT-1RO-CII-1]|uniref:S41 family peptidase n=1 Tax=Sphingobacterium sp. UT-1RO-CII-1 TaxID=2995225 RepID=UPI00227D6C18|nr:S41 family peptidase [Sphingobacterium sp. UT-1RO-CII-1]MCY4778790.1 S41 family peptidase [Sphingobacterium sp. UT-1RO-CII-1]
MSYREGYNLSFEQVEFNQPIYWHVLGNNNYLNYLDSVHVKHGKYSAVLESRGNSYKQLKTWVFMLPDHLEGKEITLSGYIKTENILNGFAALMIRIDPAVAYNIMEKQAVNGTTDWKEYRISLPLQPEKTKSIAIGGLLVGDGKAWFDDFKVFVDGKDITLLEKKDYPASTDKEFNHGSKINTSDISSAKAENLILLTKIWGFLKYHHPKIAKGELNWDYELFRFLPQYLPVNSSKERDMLLVNWIENLGQLNTLAQPKQDNLKIFLSNNIDWIKTGPFSSDLKNKLIQVYENRWNEANNHYYIGIGHDTEKPIFKNEAAYENMPYPDAGFRLLSLMRYWNIIQYYFPYRNLIDKNWEKVLEEYLPQFIHSKNELEYELAALRLICEIGDSHANIWSGADKIAQLKGDYFSPSKVEFVEKQLVVTDHYGVGPYNYGVGPYIHTPFKLGDIITHINDKKVEDLVDSLKILYSGSNDRTIKRDLAHEILRSPHTKLLVTFISNGQTFRKEITLYLRNQLNIRDVYLKESRESYFKVLESNVGYINTSSFLPKHVSELREKLKDTRGVIIDLRHSTSGADIYASLGALFIESSVPFVRPTVMNINKPGEFILRSPNQIEPSEDTYRGKVVVLVNENTQSSQEYTAMVLRAGVNTSLLGTSTAGADGNMSPFKLPGGLSTSISGIGILYPDGKQTQKIGIIPDVLVERSINAIVSGEDELLEKAIKIIKNVQ